MAKLVHNELEMCYECDNCKQLIGTNDYKAEEGWSYCPACGHAFDTIDVIHETKAE